MAIPDSMRAVQLTAYDGRPESIAIVEMPVSRPGPGEVVGPGLCLADQSIRLGVHSGTLWL
jgi:hypothetical protein